MYKLKWAHISPKSKEKTLVPKRYSLDLFGIRASAFVEWVCVFVVAWKDIKSIICWTRHWLHSLALTLHYHLLEWIVSLHPTYLEQRKSIKCQSEIRMCEKLRTTFDNIRRSVWSGKTTIEYTEASLRRTNTNATMLTVHLQCFSVWLNKNQQSEIKKKWRKKRTQECRFINMKNDKLFCSSELINGKKSDEERKKRKWCCYFYFWLSLLDRWRRRIKTA